MKVKQVKQKEVGRIKLSDNEDLVASLVDAEKLDLRIWIETDKYRGPTKRGLRFYLFDDNWNEFKKLIAKTDKAFEEID